MKILLILTTMMLSLAIHSSDSFAQSFTLLGRGVQKGNTNESIALACVEQVNGECKAAQFAYFKDAGEPLMMGARMEVPSASSDQLEDEALKLQLKYYLATKSSPQENEEASAIRNKASWAVMIGVGGAACVAGPVGLGAAVVYMAPIALAGAFLRAFPPRSLDAFLVNSGDFVTVEQSTEKDGWNWSAVPKKINAKKFDRLLNNLQSNNVYGVYGDGGELDKIARKMRKLEKSGVQFKLSGF